MSLTKTQIKLRRKGISSTDIAAICGLNPYHSPKEVYAEKLGMGPKFEETEPMHWGNLLEPVLINHYGKLNQVKVRRNRKTLARSDKPWMLATPDAFVLAEPEYGLEVKAAAAYNQVQRWGTAGDEMPEEYLLQCHWAMGVCEMTRWDMAVLLAGSHGFNYRQYAVERDDELLAMLEEKALVFLECVQQRKEPPSDGTTSSGRALLSLHAKDDGKAVLASEDLLETIDELAAAKSWVGEIERLEQKVKDAMGDGASLIGPVGERLATWKTDKRGRRVFRFHQQESKYGRGK